MTNKTTVLANGLLTNEQYAIIMESGSIAWSVLSLLGLISNIINIRTFIAMGLSDGVTVSFMFLALFDLSFLMMTFCFSVMIGLSIVEVKTSLRFQLEPYGLFMFFGNVAILLNVTNTLTTTFLAVARCMCVAKPLHFKNTFTRQRTFFFNVGFLTFAVGIYIPILAHMGMLPKLDRKTNTTRPSLWMSKEREAIKDVVFMLINTVLPFLTQLIIMVCVFIMARSLRIASRFRQASTTNPPPTIEHERSENNSNSSNSISDKLTGKDQRVVQQVLLISAVNIISNTPKILFSTVGVIDSQFSVLGIYKNLYLSVHSLHKYLEIGNASVNTFIYYSYNTKFRKNLRQIYW